MHQELARAKVNLALHVTGTTHDGYHFLDSLVAFADCGDLLTFEKASVLELTISGPFGVGLEPDNDNLILKAASLMGAPAVRIHLEKSLPVASGIGGGSADAAATLRGLSVICDLPLPSPEAQLSLGADVPVCVLQRTCRMEGIGEKITTLNGFGPYQAVLVNPGVSVPTGQVFAGLMSKENAPMALSDGSIEDIHGLRNDLERPAQQVCPEIERVLNAIESAGGIGRMSGSGATCFGLFAEAEQAADAARALARNHPKWWVQHCKLG